MFKPGDVVRVVKDTTWSVKNGFNVDDIFTIFEINPNGEVLPEDKRWWIKANSLELYEEKVIEDFHPQWF